MIIRKQETNEPNEASSLKAIVRQTNLWHNDQETEDTNKIEDKKEELTREIAEFYE